LVNAKSLAEKSGDEGVLKVLEILVACFSKE
jgi:hypothetical protein